MSYATCRDAVKTQLLAITGSFGTNDVTNGDYRVLDSAAINCAVMRPGSLALNETGSYRTEHNWDVIFDLFTKAVDDTSYATFMALLDTVIARLDAYPKLGTGGAADLLVISGPTTDGDPEDVFDKIGAGPFFIVQRVRVRVREYVTQTTGEYA
jgi:hypothetical protein